MSRFAVLFGKIINACKGELDEHFQAFGIFRAKVTCAWYSFIDVQT